MRKILQWIRAHSNNIIRSIAFYPAIIAIGFLLLSWGMLELDSSSIGREVKRSLSWLSLKDASTARSIISAIASGLISLTVFSFSMVMIVLNQAASQMSNRVLNSMIENRFQQMILGFYIGAIVYALFLLSTIRDTDSGIYVPALSIYLLIVLTVVNIFLFIYFLDYVTKTVKYEVVIGRVKKETLKSMQEKFSSPIEEKPDFGNLPFVEIKSNISGYYQNMNSNKMLEIAKSNNVIIAFIYEMGSFIIKGSTLCKVYGKSILEEEVQKDILLCCDFFVGQPVASNPNYGFRHLTEVALKALSPGINDPATAVLSLNALAELLAYRLENCLPTLLKDNDQKPRVFINTLDFRELFELCVIPIWDYGKNDRYIQNGLLHQIKQLMALNENKENGLVMNKLLNNVRDKMQH